MNLFAMSLAVGLATALTPTPTPSSATAGCDAIRARFEQSIKDAAWFSVVLPLHKSRRQSRLEASNNQSAVTSSLLLAQLNLTLLRENSCPMPTEPADPSKYMGEAIACWGALSGKSFRSPDSELPPQCDQEKWNGHSDVPVQATPPEQATP